MAPPSDAELLRFIAREEPLEATLAAFPGMERVQLTTLLARLADTLEPRPAPRVPQAASLPLEPPTGTGRTALKVYSDGAARGNPGPAGAGAVLKNAQGQVVEKLGQFLGDNTNNFAEYMGLLLGLKRARELGIQEVEIYADSELMIRQLSGRYQVKSPTLRPLFDEARALLRGFSRFTLTHIPRAQNADADEMSNRAIDERL